METAHSHRSKTLVLFSNTFPYGKGETFLADELPFVAAKFGRVIIYPLFKAEEANLPTQQNRLQQLPANVEVEEPILNFIDKNRRELLESGIFNLSPFTLKRVSGFSFKEFWHRALLGKNIPLLPGQKKASLPKRIWIFFNYLSIYRAIRADKNKWNEILRTCAVADIIYFYWGDKSVMVAPDLKRELAKVCANPPKICARLHGSDLWEGAKGYLPYREEIYASLDFAGVDSKRGYNYILDNYKNHPTEVRVCYMGSIKPKRDVKEKCNSLQSADNESVNKTLRLLSCSNIIELKRVELIFSSILTIIENKEYFLQLKNSGFEKIEWTHFGAGELMEQLLLKIEDKFKAGIEGKGLPDNKENKNSGGVIFENNLLKVFIKGHVPHSEILSHYREQGGNLFILLSRTEGVPISLMEALSYSIPIMATDVGGVSEIFNNSNYSTNCSHKEREIGYLLPAEVNEQIVANAILHYAGLKQEERYNISKCAQLKWRESWNGEINYAHFAEILSLL